MKSSIQYTTPAQIDELIARLEDRQRHGNLSTAEERRTLAEVSSPRVNREQGGFFIFRLREQCCAKAKVATGHWNMYSSRLFVSQWLGIAMG